MKMMMRKKMIGLIPTEYRNPQSWPTEALRQEMNLCRKEGRLIWRFLKAELDRRVEEDDDENFFA
jgi:hypothetical protein